MFSTASKALGAAYKNNNLKSQFTLWQIADSRSFFAIS